MKDYEEVSHFTLDPPQCERLLSTQNECVFIWSTVQGWPVGVVMSYVWRDGKVWLTSSGQRPRVAAVRRDPRVSVVVSGIGTPLGPKTITIKGRCAVHDDPETKRWFYPALGAALVPESESRRAHFIQMLDSPRRVILGVTPVKLITFDSEKMGKSWRGGSAPG